MLTVAQIFNIAFNDFGAKKSAQSNRACNKRDTVQWRIQNVAEEGANHKRGAKLLFGSMFVKIA